MMKFECEGNNCRIENTGTVLDAASEVSLLIHGLYCSLVKHDPIMALIFRKFISESVSRDDSPVWDVSSGANPSFEMFMKGPKK